MEMNSSNLLCSPPKKSMKPGHAELSRASTLQHPIRAHIPQRPFLMWLGQQEAAGTQETPANSSTTPKAAPFPDPWCSGSEFLLACAEVAGPSFHAQILPRTPVPAPSEVQSRQQEQEWAAVGPWPQTWCRVTQPVPTGTSQSLTDEALKAKKCWLKVFPALHSAGDSPTLSSGLTVIVCPHVAFVLPFFCGPEHKYGREGCLTSLLTEKMGAKDIWSS